MHVLDRITVDPEICLGQPTIRGLRITVSVILKQIASGMTMPEVVAAYPELEPEDILQALRYAAWLSSEKSGWCCPKGLFMPKLSFLADMNISPLTVKQLRQIGWQIWRVSEFMPENALDAGERRMGT